MQCIQYNISKLLLIKQAQGLASGTNARQLLILRCCLRILYQNDYRNQIIRDIVWRHMPWLSFLQNIIPYISMKYVVCVPECSLHKYHITYDWKNEK